MLLLYFVCKPCSPLQSCTLWFSKLIWWWWVWWFKSTLVRDVKNQSPNVIGLAEDVKTAWLARKLRNTQTVWDGKTGGAKLFCCGQFWIVRQFDFENNEKLAVGRCQIFFGILCFDGQIPRSPPLISMILESRASPHNLLDILWYQWTFLWTYFTCSRCWNLSPVSCCKIVFLLPSMHAYLFQRVPLSLIIPHQHISPPYYFLCMVEKESLVLDKHF